MVEMLWLPRVRLWGIINWELSIINGWKIGGMFKRQMVMFLIQLLLVLVVEVRLGADSVSHCRGSFIGNMEIYASFRKVFRQSSAGLIF